MNCPYKRSHVTGFIACKRLAASEFKACKHEKTGLKNSLLKAQFKCIYIADLFALVFFILTNLQISFNLIKN